MSGEPVPVLYRIGRAPDPFRFPADTTTKNSGNRFDDPEGRFWVLYAAEQRLACFVETLARFRVSVELLIQLDDLPDGDVANDVPYSGIVPDDWHLKRVMASFHPTADQRWLDLRVLAVRERVRRALASTLTRLSHTDFDLGDALSRDRVLTQQIARWAHEQDFGGIIYPSRFDAAYSCWAIFEGSYIEHESIRAIRRDDADMLEAARLLRLSWRA